MSNALTLATLKKLSASLARTPAKLARATATASTDIRALVAQEFSTGTNPWGRPWPAPKDGGKPLARSGALQRSVTVTADSGKIVTRATAPYARFVQRGRKTFSRRAVVREGLSRAERHQLLRKKGMSRTVTKPRAIVPARALPPTWQLALVQAIAAELGEVT